MFVCIHARLVELQRDAGKTWACITRDTRLISGGKSNTIKQHFCVCFHKRSDWTAFKIVSFCVCNICVHKPWTRIDFHYKDFLFELAFKHIFLLLRIAMREKKNFFGSVHQRLSSKKNISLHTFPKKAPSQSNCKKYHEEIQ